MVDEDKGFQVKDRRGFNVDGSARDGEEKVMDEPQGETAEAAKTREPGPNLADEAEGAQSGEAATGPLPPVEFSGLILSLAHAAMMHLGQVPDPQSGQARPDLEMARHTIDTIAMLKEKTQGNLTSEEQRLIDHALTELRLAFVQLNK